MPEAPLVRELGGEVEILPLVQDRSTSGIIERIRRSARWKRVGARGRGRGCFMTPVWADATRVLAVRLDTIGDVLMTTPAIRALSESGSRPAVTLLTSTRGARLAHLVPEIDDVIVFDPPWMKATKEGAGPAVEQTMEQRLAGEFDAAVIFTIYTQSPLPAALLFHLAGIPLRLAHCRENPYQLLTDWVAEPEPDKLLRHEVRRQLDLVASVGATPSDERLSLAPPEAAATRVRRLLEHHGVAGPFVVVHPGASAPSRRYRPEGFAEVVRRLVLEDGLPVVFTGDADERDLVAGIGQLANEPVLSLAGETDLAELAALIDDAALLISNNTAPAHMAAALGTPVVDLYALTNPQHAPWLVESRVLFHDVPCEYCHKSVCPMKHHHCLRLVEPTQVVDAARSLLPTAHPRQA